MDVKEYIVERIKRAVESVQGLSEKHSEAFEVFRKYMLGIGLTLIYISIASHLLPELVNYSAPIMFLLTSALGINLLIILLEGMGLE